MMKSLRKNIKSILWVIAIIFVTAIFAGFGGAFFFQKQLGLIAKVNGVGLSSKSFSKLYEQSIEAYHQNKEIDKLDTKTLKREILQSMIKEELLYQQAKEYDILVTPQELINTIYSYPVFQKDGKFDISLYFRILQYLRTTPQAFEKASKKSLTVTKLQIFFLSGIKVTTKELEYEYNKWKKGNLYNFEKEKEEFYKSLLLKKQLSLFDTWVQKLIRNANIKIYSKELGDLS